MIAYPVTTCFIRGSSDSMTEEGIADGDMLIVDSSLTAGAGDIVVASLAGQVYGLLYISEE
ncbi:hypothetical protein GCM10009413_30260 [Tatumella punctata]